jgi:hypothetical protein
MTLFIPWVVINSSFGVENPPEGSLSRNPVLANVFSGYYVDLIMEKTKSSVLLSFCEK